MSPRAFDDAEHKEVQGAATATSQAKVEAGVHSVAVWIAMISAIWFIAMAWISFARNGEIDYLLAIVTLFFTMFFTLFLLLASYSLHDARWPSRDTGLREFLTSRVGTATGEMTGREVLIEVALVPVALAIAATLIGLAMMLFG